jgi:hypothetical protein
MFSDRKGNHMAVWPGSISAITLFVEDLAVPCHSTCRVCHIRVAVPPHLSSRRARFRSWRSRISSVQDHSNLYRDARAAFSSSCVRRPVIGLNVGQVKRTTPRPWNCRCQWRRRSVRSPSRLRALEPIWSGDEVMIRCMGVGNVGRGRRLSRRRNTSPFIDHRCYRRV